MTWSVEQCFSERPGLLALRLSNFLHFQDLGLVVSWSTYSVFRLCRQFFRVPRLLITYCNYDESCLFYHAMSGFSCSLLELELDCAFETVVAFRQTPAPNPQHLSAPEATALKSHPNSGTRKALLVIHARLQWLLEGLGRRRRCAQGPGNAKGRAGSWSWGHGACDSVSHSCQRIQDA